MTLLEIQNGYFSYPNQADILCNISFSLKKGHILTVLGQNGAGKTTLLLCIIGLLRWKKGKTLFRGEPFSSLEDREGVGYVPQAQKSMFAFTAWEMVAMGRARHVALFGAPPKWDDEHVEKAMRTVGILDLKDRLCTQMSGGQLQLVYIARALATEPELLILDEPESHLDFRNQYRVLQLIEKLKQDDGISCVINTHYPDHALKISDETLMIHHGRMLYGKSENIITEENIQKFFEVKTRIFQLPPPDDQHRAFVVID